MSPRGDPVTVLRERVERLACDFPISENYFAWQAFGRGYDVEHRDAVPAYLQRETYDVIRTRTDKVEVHHASLTDFLDAAAAALAASLCAARRAGLDEQRTDHRAVARDRPHRR